MRAKDERQPPPSVERQKRRRIRDTKDYAVLSDSPTESDAGSITTDDGPGDVSEDTVKVVRLAWLQDSMSRGKILDYRRYLIYEAVKTTKKAGDSEKPAIRAPTSADLLRRAREVAAGSSQPSGPRYLPHGRSREGGHHTKTPALVPHSTTDENVIASLPPVPEALRSKYSCQRSTNVHPPNEPFIEKLKEVRELRAMTGDGVGVRAYSTAIASLSAYPHKLRSPIGEWSRGVVWMPQG